MLSRRLRHLLIFLAVKLRGSVLSRLAERAGCHGSASLRGWFNTVHNCRWTALSSVSRGWRAADRYGTGRALLVRV